MLLRERGYALLYGKLWKRVCRLAPDIHEARDFMHAALEIGLGEKHREQMDTLADVLAACESGAHAGGDRDLVELLANIQLRYLLQVAYTRMLRERRRTSRLVPVADIDEIDLMLIEAAYDDLRESHRADRDICRILQQIVDAIANEPDPHLADALADAFKYVYGEAAPPAGASVPSTLHAAASQHGIPPGTLRCRIKRLLDDVRLPAELRTSLHHSRSLP